jgi:ribosome-associated toxin RatA of RatAB toxin-antitoxin module
MGVTRAQDEVVADAPPGAVWTAVLDYEQMPQWHGLVSATQVLERDAQGRGTRVEFHIDVKVKKLRYVNAYSYDAPDAIDVTLVEGDLKSVEAKYRFTALGDDRTRIRHEVAVDPGMFVPAPVKRFLTDHMLKDNLNHLRSRAEELHA